MNNIEIFVDELAQVWPDILSLLGAGSAVISATVAIWLWGKKSKKSKNKIPIILHESNFVECALPLIEREVLSPRGRRYRFGMPSPEHVLGLPNGQHIHLTAKINNELVERCYSPISNNKDNFIDLLGKVYFKDHPLYPDGAKILMSQHLEKLKIGDTMDISGPFIGLRYADHRVFPKK